jgi:hypothetical protein
MKALLSMLILLAASAPALASPTDDQAVVASIVPGSIINKPWGWTINSRGGDTHVMKSSDGYTVTTPKQTFHLIRRSDGFAISPGRKGVRVLSPDEAIDVLQRKKRR